MYQWHRFCVGNYSFDFEPRLATVISGATINKNVPSLVLGSNLGHHDVAPLGYQQVANALERAFANNRFYFFHLRTGSRASPEDWNSPLLPA